MAAPTPSSKRAALFKAAAAAQLDSSLEEMRARQDLFDAILASSDLAQHTAAFRTVGITSLNTLAAASDVALADVRMRIDSRALEPNVEQARTTAKRRLEEIEAVIAAEEQQEKETAAAAAAARAEDASLVFAERKRQEVRGHFTPELLRRLVAKSLCETAVKSGKETERALAAKVRVSAVFFVRFTIITAPTDMLRGRSLRCAQRRRSL